MTGITILTIAIWVACTAWVTLDGQRRAISPVFWPLATLVGHWA